MLKFTHFYFSSIDLNVDTKTEMEWAKLDILGITGSF